MIKINTIIKSFGYSRIHPFLRFKNSKNILRISAGENGVMEVVEGIVMNIPGRV